MNLPKDLEQAIVLYLYDELSGQEKQEFETHIEFNQASRRKLDEFRKLHGVLGNRALLTPSEQTLVGARANLRDRLRDERKAAMKENWFDGLRSAVAITGRGMQLATGFALLLAGLVVGRWTATGSELASYETRIAGQRGLPAISDVGSVQYDPASGLVTVQYQTVDEVSLSGSVDDASIRHVLSYAIRSETHPGRRLAAVKATAGGSFADDELEQALVKAMEDDEIDGVRLKAAKVLKALPISRNIKRAFIRVLFKDPNPAIRIEALDALSQVQEQDVVPILRNAAKDDDNEFVRLQASRTLERTENPEVVER